MPRVSTVHHDRARAVSNEAFTSVELGWRARVLCIIREEGRRVRHHLCTHTDTVAVEGPIVVNQIYVVLDSDTSASLINHSHNIDTGCFVQ